MQNNRQSHLSSIQTIVIKFGTQLLTNDARQLDVPFLKTIANQVVALRAKGYQVTIVSSGAIRAGITELKQTRRPTDLSKLQAVAAVGQRCLMDGWAVAFEPHKLPVAQLLVTRQDIEQRTRYLNLRNTINAVHELGAIPIINENDTISIDELVRLTFGDNDILAASVAHALNAHLLVLLTVVDGILDTDGKPVRMVSSVDQARTLVREEKSAFGTGGMDSKVTAAKMLTDAGAIMAVVDGRNENVLMRLLDGEEVGTLFISTHKRLPSRNRWIGAVRPTGAAIVDDGAARAIIERHRSLLPAGIRQVEGNFNRGDVIAIRTADGQTIGRGLSNYASDVLTTICGKKTAEVRRLLRNAAHDEVIHRNNLVLT